MGKAFRGEKTLLKVFIYVATRTSLKIKGI